MHAVVPRLPSMLYFTGLRPFPNRSAEKRPPRHLMIIPELYTPSDTCWYDGGQHCLEFRCQGQGTSPLKTFLWHPMQLIFRGCRPFSFSPRAHWVPALRAKSNHTAIPTNRTAAADIVPSTWRKQIHPASAYIFCDWLRCNLLCGLTTPLSRFHTSTLTHLICSDPLYHILQTLISHYATKQIARIPP